MITLIVMLTGCYEFSSSLSQKIITLLVFEVLMFNLLSQIVDSLKGSLAVTSGPATFNQVYAF